MDLQPHLIAGFPNVLGPIVSALQQVLAVLHHVTGNYGWALILLAAAVKLVFWPLNSMQFKAMLKTQQLAPRLTALKAKYKDKAKLNEATMALYKETGANPLAGCLPSLAQLPILFSLYQAVIGEKTKFARESWLWIGSPFSKSSAGHFLAANLAAPDYVLLALYVVSMYFSVRLTTPTADPAQAQQQKIMAFISPVMIGYLGFKYAWPSALIIYWLSFNVFAMAQSLYLIRKYHHNPTAVGPHTPEDEAIASPPDRGASRSTNAKPATGGAKISTGGSRNARRRRSSRR